MQIANWSTNWGKKINAAGCLLANRCSACLDSFFPVRRLSVCDARNVSNAKRIPSHSHVSRVNLISACSLQQHACSPGKRFHLSKALSKVLLKVLWRHSNHVTRLYYNHSHLLFDPQTFSIFFRFSYRRFCSQSLFGQRPLVGPTLLVPTVCWMIYSSGQQPSRSFKIFQYLQFLHSSPSWSFQPSCKSPDTFHFLFLSSTI